MKSITRRHAASLAFICLLAIIYMIVALTHKSGSPRPTDIDSDTLRTTTASTAAPSAGYDSTSTNAADKSGNSGATISTKRRKTGKEAKRSKSVRPADYPDVLDRRMPSIHR